MRCAAAAKSAQGPETPAHCRRKANGQAGFTLVELLVVMAILVMLAGIVAPRVIGYLGTSRVKTARVQIEALSMSLELYKLDTGRYPGTGEGLKGLVERPPNVRNWNGPYLKGSAVPADPWGAAYFYRSPGRHGAFDIFCLGADKKPSGEGENQDIANWQGRVGS